MRIRKILDVPNTEIEKKNIRFLDYDKILFGDVTIDWYVTCKFNKIMALDSIRMLEIFQRFLI